MLPGVREPRVNRGRLRHCVERQISTKPLAVRRWEGGNAVRSSKSGYRPGDSRRNAPPSLFQIFRRGPGLLTVPPSPTAAEPAGGRSLLRQREAMRPAPGKWPPGDPSRLSGSLRSPPLRGNACLRMPGLTECGGFFAPFFPAEPGVLPFLAGLDSTQNPPPPKRGHGTLGDPYAKKTS